MDEPINGCGQEELTKALADDRGGPELPAFVFAVNFTFNGIPLAGVNVTVPDLPAYPETIVAIMAQAAGTMLAQSGDTGRAWEAFRAQARELTNRAVAESVAAGGVAPPEGSDHE